MAHDIATLEALLVRLEDASSDDVSLGHDILRALTGGTLWDDLLPTGRLVDAIQLLQETLPAWWWTVGLCGLTGHASIGPDYNGPQGDWLRKVFPEEIFDGGFDADLAPGDGIGRVCRALLHCVVQAHIEIRKEVADG